MSEELQQSGLNPDLLAKEWSTRLGKRLQDLGLPDEEVLEMMVIVSSFTRTAVIELQREAKVSLPYSDQVFELTTAHVLQIVDLFLRGVAHSAKKLRDTGKGWQERKHLMEALAWKLFNLAKLLVTFQYVPNPSLQNILGTSKDLQLMMKQSVDMLVEEQLSGASSGFPFSMEPPPT